MFDLPIEQIEYSHIESFCQSGIAENIILDFKRDFPQRLDKTIASFANTYGGMILIGVDETPTGKAVMPLCGVALEPGLRERVVQIGINAIYPPVVPEVRVVEFKSAPNLPEPDRAIVVAKIHETELGSHAVDNRTAVYLRVDNVSDRLQKATVEEIEWFTNKRAKALAEKARLLDVAEKHARDYLIKVRRLVGPVTAQHNPSRFRFWAVPTFPRRPLAAPDVFFKLASEHTFMLGSYSHEFPYGSAHPIANGLYFDGNNLPDYRYTEVQAQGMCYHEYGFYWVDQAGFQTAIFPNAAAELMAAALRFCIGLYERVGFLGLVDFEFQILNVKDWHMFAVIGGRPTMGNTACVDDIVAVRVTETVPALKQRGIEILKKLLQDIYWAFGRRVQTDTIERDFDKVRI